MSGRFTDKVFRDCYVYGVWEPVISAYFASRLRAGDIVIDVGANLGYHSLLAWKRVGPTGRVLALEPLPGNLQRFRRNLDLNPGASEVVRVIPKIVGAEPGEERAIYSGPASNRGASSVIPSPLVSSEPAAVVRTTSLSQVIAEEMTRDEWQRTRLIKIDVEGAELEVITGLLSSLREGSSRPDIVLEANPVVNGVDALDGTLDTLEQLGYEVLQLANSYSIDFNVSQQSRRDVVGEPCARPLTRMTDLLLTAAPPN